MKRFFVVIATVVCLAGAAATAAYAARVPGRRDGDPDEVQAVKRHDEPALGSRLAYSQGHPAVEREERPQAKRARRLRVEVRFPGREFFLEK